MTGDEKYHELRKFLDRFPLGYPETSSGIEIRILKKLFTEEEAGIAVLLTPLPEEAESIAARAGMEKDYIEKMLQSMSLKGLVFRTRREGKTLYNSAPFMIGLYEYSVNKIDAELAAMFKSYYEEAYMEEMGAGDVPGFKVLPVERKIGGKTVIYPFAKMEESIRSARRISVAECMCRKESVLTGEDCGHPMENCLSFGAAADYYIENGMGREIGVEEALRIIEEADKAGLIHAGANTKHLSNICNCCPCCCASMKGITKGGLDKHKYLNALFVAVVDAGECTGCSDCEERCPVGAMSVGEVAVVDADKCLGCGLCATGCPAEAITMRMRDDFEEPFDRFIGLGMAILKGKSSKGR